MRLSMISRIIQTEVIKNSKKVNKSKKVRFSKKVRLGLGVSVRG
jgi:hypothetical protein